MQDNIKVFHDSLRRCNEDPSFLGLFYETLLASSDKIAEKFANTDFNRQKKALALSLRMLMLSGQGDDAADVYLHYIAERHNRKDLDIEPVLYDLWLDSLMSTVRRIDTDFSSPVEEAWRAIMTPGIEYMKSKY